MYISPYLPHNPAWTGCTRGALLSVLLKSTSGLAPLTSAGRRCASPGVAFLPALVGRTSAALGARDFPAGWTPGTQRAPLSTMGAAVPEAGVPGVHRALQHRPSVAGAGLTAGAREPLSPGRGGPLPAPARGGAPPGSPRPRGIPGVGAGGGRRKERAAAPPPGAGGVAGRAPRRVCFRPRGGGREGI